MYQAELPLSSDERETLARDVMMRRAADNHRAELEAARLAAEKDYSIRGVSDIDGVRRWLDKWEIEYEPGNWMGSVFKADGWIPTGQWIRTAHRDGHRRAVREWTKRNGRASTKKD